MDGVARVQGHTVDDYLEAVYFLVSPIGEYQPDGGTTAIASRVAELLGVSRAAVGEMLKRMEADGLLQRGESREVTLTAAGTERAEQVVRRHRILERLLTDYLGYSAAEAHEHADALGGTFTDDMVDRIHERLGFPERCPHGWPVAPALEREENRQLTTLAELQAGDDCEIVRLTEHDGELLQWFYDEGLTPGAELEVRDVRPAAGHRKVWVASHDGGSEGERVIADKAARNLLVRRSPD